MRHALIVIVGILLLQVTGTFAFSQTVGQPASPAGPSGNPPKTPPEPNSTQESTTDGKSGTDKYDLNPTALPTRTPENLKKLKSVASNYMLRTPLTTENTGWAHGLTLSDYGAETVQILGQIVVDRASAQAYDVLKDKLEKQLACDDTAMKKLDFKNTCNVLKSIRLQDVVTSPSPLYKAVATDGIRNAMQLGLHNTDANIAILLDESIATLIMDAIIQAQDKANLANPEELVSEFVTRFVTAKQGEKADFGDVLNPAQKAVLIASLAVVRCKQLGTPDSSCKYSDLVDQIFDKIGPESLDVRVGAKSLTKNLLIALTRSNTDSSTRPQYHAAVAALFDATCMLESKQANGCDRPIAFGSGSGTPVPEATAAATQINKNINTLRLSRDVALAAIDGDSNGMINSIQQVVVILEDTEIVKKNHARALALCGGMLNYAATYTVTDGTSKDAHQARTKILESLTNDMTNRTGRKGDSIWSVGGSLRLAAGARLGRGSAFYGPLSLPIGFGYQYKSGEPSLHLEFSVLDIGQYVSSQQGGTVQSPKLPDSLAPSATVGVAWGKQLPYFLAVTGGYSPQYKFNDTDSKRGAYFAGVVFGIYVPFLDLN
jgi:hypothetical protein